MSIDTNPWPAVNADSLTLHGVVLFRNSCPADLIRSLSIDPGLGHLTRSNPTVERERLIETARCPDGTVTLAYTDHGAIVGYVAVAPPDTRDRWGNIRGVYELQAIDVSRSWRCKGIGSQLLRHAFRNPVWDQRIVFATAYSWHWDLTATGLTKIAYAKMLAGIMRSEGFVKFETDEANIRWDEANMLLVRVGPDVDESLYSSFQSRLFEYRF